MPQVIRHQLWIAAVAAVVLFFNLGGPRLWDEDEPRNATCAREMLTRGDWIVPSFNGKLRTDKPILVYWLMMSAYRTLGDSEFSARFWSAALAVGTSLLTYHLGRLLFRAEVGFWASIMLATTLMFDVSGRAATTDSTLLFCITLSLLAFVYGLRASNTLPLASRQGSRRFADLVPRSWLSFVGMYAAMGLAVLAKGPIGLLAPAGVIGLYLLLIGDESRRDVWNSSSPTAASVLHNVQSWLRKLPLNFVRALWAMRPLTLLVVVSAVAIPWYLAVDWKTDGLWTRGFFGDHNFRRFSEAMEGHRGPFFYYLPAIVVGFFPWSILFPGSVATLVVRLRQRHAWQPGYVLLASWVSLIVVGFSCAATKLPSYVLPAYPALALLVATFVDRWLSEPAVWRPWLRVALVTLGLVGVGLIAGLLIVSRRLLPGEALLAMVGVIPLVGAVVALYFNERLQVQAAVVALGATAVLMAVGLFGVAAPRVSRHQNSEPLVSAAHELAGKSAELASYRYNSSGLVYYSHSHISYLDKPKDVAEFLAADENRFVVISAEQLDDVQSLLPPGVQPLVHLQRFARTAKEMLLLGRPTQTARTAKSPQTH